jgi:hypothetical protein
VSWTRLLPLRFILRRAARSQGFLDPLELLARLRSLAQPSEVGEPIELLRAGLIFHARGLINSRVIQHNLDWVWPYWIERQYDPRDISFMPRAFSVSHINLSHRNWTAIGYPDSDSLPIVDPRGLLTPFHDGWSLDAWLLTRDGRALLPSRSGACHQTLMLDDLPTVMTRTRDGALALTTNARVMLDGDKPVCQLEVIAEADCEAQLAIALRPQNPEGVSFIHTVTLLEGGRVWTIDGNQRIEFETVPDKCALSDYRSGDVFLHIDSDASPDHCDAGLLTGAALFELDADRQGRVRVDVPLARDSHQPLRPGVWQRLQTDGAEFVCPEEDYTFLYNAAVASLILHSPRDVYPGPYTYKRFWFRDAVFMLHAMLCVGLSERVERSLRQFPSRQTRLGFFRSQEGEWDSNGEVLWLLARFRELTGRMPRGNWGPVIVRGGKWIVRKRLTDQVGALHAGLMPAGFSAEHLGPNDYYYWDDFWSVSGLRCAATMVDKGRAKHAAEFVDAADKLEHAVTRSLAKCEQRLGRPGMPASPYRRLDAGAIGSLAVSYPLQLWEPADPRIEDCVEYLLEHCFVDGVFFQDMVHSGLNAYLTLHVAQALLRMNDSRCLDLMDNVAQIASPTGQWPEAIHPITGGGCMGDGHHAWASAEWVLMLRNCFVRDEGGRLVLCSGIPLRWLQPGADIRFGPTPTPFGPVTVTVIPTGKGRCEVICDGEWRDEQPDIDIYLPGYPRCRLARDHNRVTLAGGTASR